MHRRCRKLSRQIICLSDDGAWTLDDALRLASKVITAARSSAVVVLQPTYRSTRYLTAMLTSLLLTLAPGSRRSEHVQLLWSSPIEHDLNTQGQDWHLLVDNDS